MLKTPHMFAVEARFRRPLEQILREAWERTPSSHSVARALGITPQTVRRWMIALALEPHSTLRKRRDGPQAEHDMRAANHKP